MKIKYIFDLLANLHCYSLLFICPHIHTILSVKPMNQGGSGHMMVGMLFREIFTIKIFLSFLVRENGLRENQENHGKQSQYNISHQRL